jgi:hypothetical protein
VGVVMYGQPAYGQPMYGQPIAQPIRPSRGWYGLAAGLLVLAGVFVALAIVSFAALFSQVDSFQRGKVPGQAQLSFTSGGGYLLYFEGPGMSHLGRTGELRVQIQTAAGTQVPISQLHGRSETYDLSGHSGQAVASVTIPRPGKYEISAGISTSPAPTDIAVGKGIGGSIVRAVLFLLVALLVFGPGSLVTGLVTFFRRRRARARAQFGPPMGPPTPPY